MDHVHDAHGNPADPHAGHHMPPAAHGSRDRHVGHSVAMFRDKFWLSFALTIPTVFWSPEIQHWLGYTAPAFPGSRFIPAVFGTAVFLYGGLVFVRGAQDEHSDPRDVGGAIELSRATYRKMIQNLIWATAYNLVAIPVAGGLFVRWGFDLPMSVGAVAMSASTIIVAINAQLLRHLTLKREPL